MQLRRSPQTTQLLLQLLERPEQWHHGYELSRQTGLKSGTLYPILIRLHERGLLETRWEPSEDNRPPRHIYRLTGPGLRTAREYISAQLPVTHLHPSPAGA